MNPGRRTVRHLVHRGRDFFAEWIVDLQDALAVRAIFRRLDRLAQGNFGDCRPVGGGVWELKIRLGPGYRIYYGLEGLSVVLLILGGEKSDQDGDILRARSLWRRHRASLR